MKKNKRDIFVLKILIAILLYLIFIFWFIKIYNKNNNNLENEKDNSQIELKEEKENKILTEENEIENLGIDNNIYKYAKSKINVYENEKLEKIIYSIDKGSKITVLEMGEFSKIVEKNDVKSEIKYNLLKIKYNDGISDKEGWIKEEFLEDSLKSVLPKSWGELDFNHYKKASYINNPKVKAKGIYVTANTIAIPSRLEEMIKIAKENNINTFVIDVKEDVGTLSFDMPEYIKNMNPGANNKPKIKNIREIISRLKENNIYLIARVVSFKDPIYAKNNKNKSIVYKKDGTQFSNKDGLAWVSPYDRNLWNYNVEVSKEAARVGFNEIQFDYVRFPASNGGKLDSELDYRNEKNESKVKAIQEYLKYAKENLEPLGVYLSVAVYGQVASSDDDMSLGQHYETMANIVDYISPMEYPSHYGSGVYGLKVPDANPYKTVYHSTKDALKRSKNIDESALVRPWIQAFTAKWVKGHINYGPDEIKEQVKALKDLGVEEYILWSPTNRYDRYF